MSMVRAEIEERRVGSMTVFVCEIELNHPVKRETIRAENWPDALRLLDEAYYRLQAKPLPTAEHEVAKRPTLHLNTKR